MATKYLTQDIEPAVFEKIEVTRQDEIEERWNEPLIPKQGWLVLRKYTNDFTRELPNAHKLDQLLYKLLERNNLTGKKAKKKSSIRPMPNFRKWTTLNPAFLPIFLMSFARL